MTERKPDASSQPLLKRLASSSAVMGMLPENPGYNGSVLLIDDEEAARVVKDLDDALACIREQRAALEKVTAACGSHENWNGETREFLIACENVQAKWEIEK